MSTRYYHGDASNLYGLTREEVILETTDSYLDLEDSVTEMVDDLYEPFEIAGMTFYPSDIIKNCDPIAWREVLSNEIIEIDTDDYPSEDDEEND